jgi:sialic acid synthase SpsE
MNESQYDMAKKLELNYCDFIELKKYCDEKDILFLSTPDEEKSAKFLAEQIKVPFIKVGSGELTNLHYLDYLSSLGLPLIVSTGMGTIEEIKTAQTTIYGQNNKNVIFLHCTTDYPTRLEDVNLNAMLTMKKELGTIVGYSDHTMGIETPLIAVALGAKVIEKHFTYDRNAFGPDHKSSLSPDQLKELVIEIRELEKIDASKRIDYIKNKFGSKLFDLITGSPDKKPTYREKLNKSYMRKSIVASRDIPLGTILKKEHFVMKRANIRGIPADKFHDILGKKTVRDIKKNELIERENLK